MRTSLRRASRRLRQTVARDQAAAGEIEVEKAEDPSARQAPGESFEAVEFARRVAAADDRADRRAGDDVGDEAGLGEGAEDADMSPAAGGAAAEGDAEASRGGSGGFGSGGGRSSSRRRKTALPNIELTSDSRPSPEGVSPPPART